MPTNSIRVWFTDQASMTQLAGQIVQAAAAVSEASEAVIEKALKNKFKLENG